MKIKFLFVLLFIFSTFSYSQKIVSMEDFEDNQESYVGKQITIWVSYENRWNGCQLRKCCEKFSGDWVLWKDFRWFGETGKITINIPDRFFDNDGILLPNVTDGGSLLATVYVYKGQNHKTPPRAGSTYSEGGSTSNVISLELVSMKRSK